MSAATQLIDMNMFRQDVAQAAEINHKRQTARGIKSDEITVCATLQAFMAKTQGEGGKPKNVEVGQVPAPEMRTAREKGTKYPAPLKLKVRIISVSEVPDASRRIKDDDAEKCTGAAEWQVRADVKYFDEARKYLLETAAAVAAAKAAAEAGDEDGMAGMQTELAPELQQYVAADGELATSTWLHIKAGDIVSVKVGDRPDNIFRSPSAVTKDMPLVQPGAELIFSKVVGEVWVGLSEPEAGSDNPPSIRAYPALECKGSTALDEDYDPNVCESERMHDSRDYGAHTCVPIEEFRQNTGQLANQSASFYVVGGERGIWSSPPGTAVGATILRDPIMSTSDFFNTWQEQEKPAFTLRFSKFQWSGVPSLDNKYEIKACCSKDTAEDIWRTTGITSLRAYCYIMGSNPDLGVHLDAKIWTKATLELAANDPATINNKDEVKNVRGYYVYLIQKAVFDHLRYFREHRALQLSQDRVEVEFEPWITESRGKTKRRLLALTPTDPTKANPLNRYKTSSAVAALGNGQPDPEDDTRGLNHAYMGDAIGFFDGNHEFFVLTSHQLTADERATYCVPGAPMADDLLDQLIEREGVYYWIFAVRKDAKMARSYVPPAVADEQQQQQQQQDADAADAAAADAIENAAAAAAQQQQGVKRDRDIEPESPSDVEEESSASDSGESPSKRQS